MRTYTGVLMRWTVSTGLSREKRAAYVVENGLSGNPAVYARATRLWDKNPGKYEKLEEDGLVLLLQDLLPKNVTSMTQCILLFMAFMSGKTKRKAGETMSDFLGKKLGEAQKIEKLNNKMKPSDRDMVFSAIVGLGLTPAQMATLQNKFSFKSFLEGDEEYGWDKFCAVVEEDVSPLSAALANNVDHSLFADLGDQDGQAESACFLQELEKDDDSNSFFGELTVEDCDEDSFCPEEAALFVKRFNKYRGKFFKKSYWRSPWYKGKRSGKGKGKYGEKGKYRAQKGNYGKSSKHGGKSDGKKGYWAYEGDWSYYGECDDGWNGDWYGHSEGGWHEDI